MERKKLYKIDNIEAQKNNNNNVKGLYYTNKGNNKKRVNFVRIVFGYDRSNAFFQSLSALYKYFEKWYKVDKISMGSEDTSSSFSWPIISFTTNLFTPGSSFAFIE